MSAVRSKVVRERSENLSHNNDSQRQTQDLVMESSDDDRDSESEMSETSDKFDASEESSDEENSNNSVEEESGDDENTIDHEHEVESSGDENVESNDWMQVDDIESDHNSSSSGDDDEPSNKQSGVQTSSGDPKLHGNEGWADAMAKILRTSKPKGKKSIVLAKAKKLSQIPTAQVPEEAKEDYGFEIDGKVEEEDVKPKVEEIDVKPEVKPVLKVKRKDLLANGKVRPSIRDREREKALSKIATKGVVQLFNAVRQQQKDINNKMKEARGSIRREENVLKSIDKRAFLDVLMGNAVSERIEDNINSKAEKEIKEEKPDKPATWSVLRDNFLTGSDLKDWDKCGEIKVEDDAEEVVLN